MPVTEYLGVRLNMNNQEDSKIYYKLQNYPKGKRSEIIKEALKKYLGRKKRVRSSR